ncbi:hypothetical protein [Pseudomonas chlororaphis]|uniref:hypothetical protein n=1 Tax=Pseudomonas chlororaphis TaxID=587753 RepID=UPI0012DABDC0|nr:hypothetical protein [Pseudomonas chlororaphis]
MYLDENIKLAVLPQMGGGIHVDTAGVRMCGLSDNAISRQRGVLNVLSNGYLQG